MTATILHTIVPKQTSGSHTGATSRRTMQTRHDALVLFEDARKRLLDVNNWRLISGAGSEFRLTDASGNELNSKTAEEGNLIRIKLPAPPNTEGEGYDWVRIEAFEASKDLLKDEELFGFRVRPIENPKHESEGSAHFYTSDATSSFVIVRKSSVVIAMERGRNEKVNFAGSVFNKLRNAVVALGAMLGLAHPQWKSLTDGLLQPQAI